MTNPSAGFGLRAVGRYDGAALNLLMEEVQIAYNNANTFGTGDLVKALNTGYIDKYTAGGAQVKGVFMGCKYFSSAVGRTIWSPIWNAPSLASNLVVTAWILSDPGYLFEIRGDQDGAIGQTSIGVNADVTVGTPNSITGQSTTLVDNSTILDTATLPLRIHSIASYPNIDNSLAGNIVLVSLNTSVYRTNTGV